MTNSNFIPEQDYCTKRDRLQQAIHHLNQHNSPEQQAIALQAYQDYLKLRDQAIPLLLSCQDSEQQPAKVQLTRAPSHILLLPPGPEQTETRYVICLLPKIQGSPADIQIIRWTVHSAPQTTQASQVTTQFLNFAEPTQLDERCTLAEPPLSIQVFDQDETEIVFRLTFAEGRLTVTVTDPNKEQTSLHTAWNTKPDQSNIRVQRSTYGDMPDIAWIDLEATHWPDQKLSDSKQNPIPLTGTQQYTGQIKGADAPAAQPGKPTPIYLASNLSHLICAHPTSGGYQIQHSTSLGGYLEGIIVMDDPEQSPGTGHVILIPSHDGNLYLFNSLNENEELLIRHWQSAKNDKIYRIIGRPDGHILVLNQYQQIIALRLYNPNNFIKLRNEATKILFNNIWQDTTQTWLDTLTPTAYQQPKTQQQIRLILEAWLLHSTKPHPSFKIPPCLFDDMVIHLQLHFDPEHHTAWQTLSTLAYIYHGLLQRIWQWMGSNCQARHLKISMITEQAAQTPDYSQHFIQEIMQLIHIPVEAPDWIWLQLFRSHDWLPLWQQTLSKNNQTQLNSKIQRLQKNIQTKRNTIALQTYQSRGILAQDSCRLSDPVRHLHSFNKCHMIGIINAQTLVLINTQDINYKILEWMQDEEKNPWQGQVCSLSFTTGSNLQNNQLLVTTNRGECYLLNIQDTQYKIQAKTSIDLDCTSTCYMDFQDDKQQTKRAGFIIGGNNPQNQAALYWLEIKQSTLTAYPIWYSEIKGRLRVIAPDYKDKHLWGVDEINGQCLSWPLHALEMNGPKKLFLKPTTHITTGQPLYTLYVNRKDTKKQQIVYAGSAGIVTSFYTEGKQTELLHWQIDCGYPVRRIRRVAIDTDTGYWILSGDASYCTLVDDQGQMTRLIEQVGPVSSTVTLQQPQHTHTQTDNHNTAIAIASESGRMILLNWDAPDPVSDNPPNTLPILYPLRTHQAISSHTLLHFIKTILAPENTPHKAALEIETLILHRLINAFYAGFDNEWSAEQPGDYTKLLPILIQHLSIPQASLILQRAQTLTDGTTEWLDVQSQYVIQLLTTLWNDIKQRECDEKEPITRLINTILSLAEPIVLAEYKNPAEKSITHSSSQTLLTNINQFIWPKSNQKTPLPNKQTHHLQLTQATRTWQRLSPGATIQQWVQQLTRLWQTPTPQICRDRLQQILNMGFPLQGAEYGLWLVFFQQPSNLKPYQTIGLDTLLTPPADDQLSIKTLKTLKSIFDDRDWHEWLTKLQTLLDQLRNSQIGHHNAYQEDRCLRALAFHINERAETVFQPGTPLSLLGLIWSPIQINWNTKIAQQQEKLLNLSIKTEHHYIDHSIQVIWEDTHHIRFNIQLINRNVKSIQIKSIQHANRPILDTNQHISLVPSQPHTEPQLITGTLHLPNIQAGQLNETILLSCEDGLERHFKYAISLQDQRSLATFRNAPGWAESYQRLKQLIDTQHPFAWLKGPFWSQTEHERLWRQFSEEYPETTKTVKIIASDTLHWPIYSSLYIPDLRIDPAAPDLLTQLHAILYQTPYFHYHPVALALWLEHNMIPQPLTHVLSKHARYRTAILQQFSDLAPQANQQLKKLNQKTVTTWGCADPWSHTIENNLGMLGYTFWNNLYQEKARVHDIKNWLKLPTQQIEQTYAAYQLIQSLENKYQINNPKKDITTTGFQEKKILSLLFSTTPDARLSTPYVDQTLHLLHHDYNGIYFISPDIPIPKKREKKALWLIYQQQKPTSLEADVLLLDHNQLLTLLCCTNAKTRLHRFNQIAVHQFNLQPEKIFQSSGGLAAEQLERLFYGQARHELVEQLAQLAMPKTQPRHKPQSDWSYTVIASGRRVGKTTLLQMLTHRLAQAKQQPLVLNFNFLGIPTKLTNNGLLHWFLAQARQKLQHDEKQATYTWTQIENPKQRHTALTYFEQYLDTINQRQGCPVFLFDETHHLIEQDAQTESPYALFNYLKRLVAEGRIILIATTVPFGTPESRSLWQLRNDPQTPFYNTGQADQLAPWMPYETWGFIHDQLSGFGIIIPDSFKLDILALCRGVAWIAQQICQQICQRIRTTQHTCLQMGDWEEIKNNIREDIYEQLYNQVKDAAQQHDQMYDIDEEINPTKSLAIDDRLWHALLTEAHRIGYLTLTPDIHTAWPDSIGFTRDKLYSHLQDHVTKQQLDKTLSLLTGSSVLLLGSGTKMNHYYFAYDLIHHCTAMESHHYAT